MALFHHLTHGFTSLALLSDGYQPRQQWRLIAACELIIFEEETRGGEDFVATLLLWLADGCGWAW